VPPENADLELIRAVLAEEAGAWSAFQERFDRLMLACVRRTLRCYGASAGPADVEDLLAAVCLNLVNDGYRKLRQYDPRRGYRLSSWVGLIATNTVIDALRRRGPEHAPLDTPGTPAADVPAAAPDPHAELDRAEEVRALEAALSRLPAADRRFLEYTLDHELDPTVVARLMGITVATVYSRKNKIREKLRRLVLRALAEREGRAARRVGSR
jgi:RNA polymerase sigma-70 factor (ECF subfamily)